MLRHVSPSLVAPITGAVALSIFAAGASAASLPKTFTPSDTSDVHFAVNNDTGDFFVKDDQIPADSDGSDENPNEKVEAIVDTSGSTDKFSMSATDSGNDAGVVFFFDGGLSLNEILGMRTSGTTLDSTASDENLPVNLWVDEGGDGDFFNFNQDGELTGTDGDTWFGSTINSGDIAFDGDTVFDEIPGGRDGFTLAELQAGEADGITGSETTALWVGLIGGSTNTAEFESFTTTPTPVAGLSGLAMFGLLGVAGGRRMSRARKRADEKANAAA